MMVAGSTVDCRFNINLYFNRDSLIVISGVYFIT